MKKCDCGIIYTDIPKGAKLTLDSVVPGYYYNCKCNSTLVWPYDKGEKMFTFKIDGRALTLWVVIFASLALFFMGCKAEAGPYSGKCGASFPLKMVTVAKADGNRYIVKQNLGYGSNPIGVIEATKTQLRPETRVNMNLAFVRTEKFKGANGFEYPADVWRECTPGKEAVKTDESESDFAEIVRRQYGQ